MVRKNNPCKKRKNTRIERYKNIPDEELVVRIKTYYGSELAYPTSELEIVKEDDFEEDEFEIEQIIDEIARILARNGYIYMKFKLCLEKFPTYLS